MNNSTSDSISVGLYIRGDELDPDVITTHLGVVPSVRRRRGDERPSGATDKHIVAKIGLWAKVIDSDGGKVEDILSRLVAELPPSLETVRTLPLVQEAYFDIFVARMVEASGRTDMESDFQESLLARLAAGRLALRITIAAIPSNADPGITVT